MIGGGTQQNLCHPAFGRLCSRGRFPRFPCFSGQNRPVSAGAQIRGALAEGGNAPPEEWGWNTAKFAATGIWAPLLQGPVPPISVLFRPKPAGKRRRPNQRGLRPREATLRRMNGGATQQHLRHPAFGRLCSRGRFPRFSGFSGQNRPVTAGALIRGVSAEGGNAPPDEWGWNTAKFAPPGIWASLLQGPVPPISVLFRPKPTGNRRRPNPRGFDQGRQRSVG